MRLLQEQRISQGKVAELLGVTRYNLFDLVARKDGQLTRAS